MRLEALILAGLLTAPALKEAFVDGTMPLEDALLRYVAAAIVCTVALAVLRSIYFGYAATAPRRRRSDKMPGLPAPRPMDVTETLTAVDNPDTAQDRRKPPATG